MLTLDSILRTTKHNASFGDTGPHRFGEEAPRSGVPVARDPDAMPKPRKDEGSVD